MNAGLRPTIGKFNKTLEVTSKTQVRHKKDANLNFFNPHITLN